MISVSIGETSAELTDRTWSCPSTSIRRMLQAQSDALVIHGGIPDVEQAIVRGLIGLDIPLRVTSQPPGVVGAGTGQEIF